MHYSDGAFYRPLFENNMLQLQVATGCSHNRCAFCDMYKQPFCPSPHEEILQDLDEMQRYWPECPRIFLTGGNALCLPQRELVFILEQIARRFPIATVGSFARVTDIERKTDAQLTELVALGLCDVSIGTESGLDRALQDMGKGFSAEQSLEQCLRLERAGMSYNLFYLLGMAGHGAAQESAVATAELYGKLAPRRIMIHTMTAFEGTELSHRIAQGEFAPAEELETVCELREFVARYQPREHVFLLGNHVGNVVHSAGYLPDDREKLLRYYDYVLASADEGELTLRRAGMTSI